MKAMLLKRDFFLSFIILIFCSTASNAQAGSANNAEVQGFVLEFKNVNMPEVSRALNLSFMEGGSDSYDANYDSKNLELMENDLNLTLGGEFYTTKVFSPITEEKTIDLVFQSSGDYNFTIKLRSMENMDDRNIELRDNLLGTTFNLRSGDEYQFSSVSGYFPGRFQLTFKTTTLSNNDFELENLDMRYVNSTNEIVISNPMNTAIKGVEMFSITGQKVYNNQRLSSEGSVKYNVSNINTGIYILRLKTDNNGMLTKKIMVN